MRSVILATALTLAALPALAAPWVIDPASTLTFTGKQAGEAFTGRFTKFTPVVEFDPAKPETGSITVSVDMATATIDDGDKQDSLPTSDWFHTSQFPTATFTSTRLKQVGRDTNTYQAEGNLELRGVSKPVLLSFTFSETAGIATVDGQATLDRSNFGVGQGQWTTDEWIAYPVEVKFHLKATKP